MDNTHGRTTSSMACHHRLWTAKTVERRRAWHDITALGLHARSDDVWRGMTSSPFDSIEGRTTSGVTWHHRPWTAHTVEQHRRDMPSPPLAVYTVKRRRVWHAKIAFGKHTRSNNVAHGMPSSHFGQHRQSNDVGRGMPSWPLDTTHGRTKSGVACHHSP